MKSKCLIVFSLILLILTLGAVSAEDNITGDICQRGDSEVLENTVSGNTFNDIQDNISSCNDGDTVELEGVYNGSGSPISISKSITIEGNGAKLNANNKSSILKVTSRNLTLKNIIFTNSNQAPIYSYNCNLVIINCTFIHNGGELHYDRHEKLYTVSCDYAGVYADGGKLTIINSSFSDNVANYGYSVAVIDGELNAKNTVFSSHNLDYIKMACAGHIIELENSKSNLDNCTFRDNTVAAFYTTTYAVVNNSLFENNYEGITYDGKSEGGITSSSVINIYNTTFKKTKEGSILTRWNVLLNIDGCRFLNNNNTAIEYDSKLVIKNSEFIQNKATYGAVLNGVGDATVENSRFTQNSAKYGGTFYSNGYWDEKETYTNTLKIANSTINDSSSTSNGGAIFAQCCDITLDNVNISTKSSSKGSQISLKAGTFKSTNSKHDAVKIEKIEVIVDKIYPFTTTYDSGKKFSVNIVQVKDGEYWGVDYVKVKFKVYTGKKYKVYTFKPKASSSNPGFKIDSSLSAGKHKVKVICDSKIVKFTTKTCTITIKKIKTTVKAKKITAKYKKSKYFKITVKTKYGAVIPKVKIKLKVYTGKKYKSYTLKTNKKGVAKFNTKKLKRGTHKVVITSKNNNYAISKKSSIKIK